ncbi:MAG: hypothetical protein IPH95_02680 [Candidatus Promineofilum sp.]|nr:hypothetical protein [Promineifilum sp.]
MELFSAHYLPPALLAVVVCALLTHNVPIYRSQREGFDNRQIAPGVAVRRVMVPATWDRRTMVELDLRRRFNVTIMGCWNWLTRVVMPVCDLTHRPRSISTLATPSWPWARRKI